MLFPAATASTRKNRRRGIEEMKENTKLCHLRLRYLWEHREINCHPFFVYSYWGFIGQH
jgi:hypothetical protein